jgi:hypothetical protein
MGLHSDPHCFENPAFNGQPGLSGGDRLLGGRQLFRIPTELSSPHPQLCFELRDRRLTSRERGRSLFDRSLAFVQIRCPFLEVGPVV